MIKSSNEGATSLGNCTWYATMVKNGPRNIFIGLSLQLNVASQISGQTVPYYAKSGKFVFTLRVCENKGCCCMF